MAEDVSRPKNYKRLRDQAPPPPPHLCRCATPIVWPGCPMCCGCAGELPSSTLPTPDARTETE